MTMEFPLSPVTDNHSYEPCWKYAKGGKRHLSMKMVDAVTDYKTLIRAMVVAKGIKPIKGDVIFIVRWYRARKAGDTPGRWKALCDALESKGNHGYGMYENDRQIAEFHVSRHDGEKDEPRAEVTCIPLEKKE